MKSPHAHHSSARFLRFVSPRLSPKLLWAAMLVVTPALMGSKGCELVVVGDELGSCGGLTGTSCESDEFCSYPPAAQCGAADATGVCEERPELCPEIYDPVCGCDDQTYGNECEAHAAGVSVASSGACDGEDPGTEPGKACGGLTGAGCDPGEFCNYPVEAMCGAADALGSCQPIPDACTLIHDPVCGCDDQTYGNACEANGAGVSVASFGACPGDERGDAGSGDEPAPGTSCGGLTGEGCEAGEFCDYPIEAMCGAADATGTCKPVPEVCTKIYDPVCGCDDQTYGNACEANGAGVSVASPGPCPGDERGDAGSGDEPAPGTSCGGLTGEGCKPGEFCQFPVEASCGAADALGSCQPIPDACTLIYDPVCGCDDQTYGNACEASSAGVSVASFGPCPGDEDEPAPGESCGGLTGAGCEPGEFCNYPIEAMCGAADATGTCEPTPEACTRDYRPVCGCDGQTYGNACSAHAAGVSIAAEGECEEDVGEERLCGGLTGAQCEEDEFCSYPPEANCGSGDATGVCAWRPEACTQQYDPVCGCDGKTYGNACTAASAGVSVTHDGQCQ